ncbi:MAG: outer membrane lipoprotein-sorting protein, partial [Bacteroidales bacterium]|nr:outer membrane lipoprotein-sorting protein [Bacteroidales bacterium]
ADFDGDLYNYEEKGSSLEFVGTEEAEGTEVYKLKLTKENEDVTNYFIDTETYIVLKTTAKRLIQEVEVESETILGNYQMIDDMAFPFSISSGMNGQVVAEIVITEVIFDVEIEDDFFAKPNPQE